MDALTGCYAAISCLAGAVGVLYAAVIRSAAMCDRDRRELWQQVALLRRDGPMPPAPPAPSEPPV